MSKEIGMKLKLARESLGMSIIDIARKTNIELKYLIAIEKGEWDRLPNVIYARAYVKKYAQLVGESVQVNRSTRRGPVTHQEPTYSRRTRIEQKGPTRQVYQQDAIHTKKRRIVQAEVIESHEATEPRKLTMPKDMPAPEEVGIEEEPIETVEVEEEKEVYASLPSRREKEHKASRRVKNTGSWELWYSRVLIGGGILLLLGFGLFLYLKLTSPSGLPLA